ncbi:hypothetical protein M885DRAFT_610227 [Pelagophyceae sp. CCMP2097]|nr:hypothetical protein M885DRAFT_610227 [Pelagophyceae sp. CCMP2097]
MSRLALGAAARGRVFGSGPAGANAKGANEEGVVLMVTNRKLRPSSTLRMRFTLVGFGSDWTEIAAVDERGTLWAFDLRRGRDEYREVARLGRATALCLVTTRGRTAVVVALCTPRAPAVHVYDFATGKLECVVKETHRELISSMDAHKTAPLLVTCTPSLVQLWDLARNWTKLQTASSKAADIVAAKFSEDPAAGDVLAVLYRDGTIRTLDARTMEPTARFSCASARPLRCLAVCGEDVAGGGRGLYEWRVGEAGSECARVSELPPGCDAAVDLCYSPKTAELLALLDDGRVVALQDDGRGCLAVQYDVKPRGASAAVAFALDGSGETLVIATSDGGLVVVDTRVARSRAARAKIPGRENLLLAQRVQAAAKPAPLASTDAARASPQEEAPKKSKPKRAEAQWRAPLHRAPQFGGAAPDDSRLQLDERRVRSLLAHNGEYPAKHRTVIWRSLLRLPENDAAFSELAFHLESQPNEDDWAPDGDSHSDPGASAVSAARDRLQGLSCDKVRHGLLRVVGAAARWCPAVGAANWLASACFPFVNVFGADVLCAFEAVVCVLGHWAPHFVSCGSEPPAPLLAALDSLIAHLDSPLAQHLAKLSQKDGKGLDAIAARHWAWPLLRSMLSEVLPRDQWLRLWDSLITHHEEPERLALAAVAFAMGRRDELLSCGDVEAVEAVVRRPILAAFGDDLVARVLRLRGLTFGDARLLRLARGVPDADGDAALNSIAEAVAAAAVHFPWPLPRGAATYPVIAFYPKTAVDFARREREAIALEQRAAKDVRRLEDACVRAAREAAKTAARFAASERSESIARGEAEKRAAKLSQQRREQASDAFKAGAALRMDFARQAEVACQDALETAQRRRDADFERAAQRDAAAAADVVAQRDELRSRERVAQHEAAALLRVEAIRRALSAEASARETREEREALERRVQLEAAAQMATIAADDAERHEAARRSEAAHEEEDELLQRERSRRSSERSYLELCLRREAEVGAVAQQRRLRHAAEAAEALQQGGRRDADRRDAAEATVGLARARELAQEQRNAEASAAAERQRVLHAAERARAAERQGEQAQLRAVEKEAHDAAVAEAVTAARARAEDRAAAEEEALHSALCDVAADRAAAAAREAGATTAARQHAAQTQLADSVRRKARAAALAEHDSFDRVREELEAREALQAGRSAHEATRQAAADAQADAAVVDAAAATARRNARDAEARRVAENFAPSPHYSPPRPPRPPREPASYRPASPGWSASRAAPSAVAREAAARPPSTSKRTGWGATPCDVGLDMSELDAVLERARSVLDTPTSP